MAAPGLPNPRVRRRIPRKYWVVIGVGLVLAVTISSLVLLPVWPTTTSLRAVVPGTCVYCPAITPPPTLHIVEASPVQVQWESAQGQPADVVIGYSYDSTACWWNNATSGSCSFTSTGATYTFYVRGSIPVTVAAVEVNFTVTYHRALVSP